MILKDLRIRSFSVGRDISDNVLFVLEISSNVVIKRDNKFYYVPLKLRYDITREHDLINSFNELMESFEKQADKIEKHWKLVEEDTFEGIHGRVIMQKPFNLNEELSNGKN